MAFPSIHSFPASHPGPYERQMGELIVSLVRVFAERLPDADSHAIVAELAAHPTRWSAAHAVFDELRRRLLVATDRADPVRSAQYCLEESCCQAMYNATDPPDPFDPISAFFAVPQALRLAQLVGVSLDAVAGAVVR